MSPRGILRRRMLAGAGGTLAATLMLACHSAEAEDNGLGAYLAAECVSCHQPGAAGREIATIAGRSKSEFIAAMRAFRAGERRVPEMRSVAASLSEGEIEALATFFAELEPGETWP